MFNHKNNRGQNLIEVLIAMGLFFIFAVGSLILISKYLTTFTRAAELTQVKYIVQEGFEAIQSISYNNWSSFADGTYGLNKSSGQWQFQASPNLINNKFTRSITISSAERDENCNLVANGGSADPDTKIATVNINWTTTTGEINKSTSKLYAKWYDPTNCLAEGEAGNLIINVITANIDSTKKSLVNIILENEGSVPITIDKMTLTWTKPGKITYIKIDGVNHWHSTNGTGTPQGAQLSGTELDIVDLLLEAGQDYDINAIRFNEKVDGSTFTITVIMSDGSSTTEITTPPFVP
ncbi:hypothetical protein HQ571_06685 [Candidatus Kuenenbacteria bacterium]|nr:hypothetical protein [Candidatus Kuenenbacteria bacterium]